MQCDKNGNPATTHAGLPDDTHELDTRQKECSQPPQNVIACMFPDLTDLEANEAEKLVDDTIPGFLPNVQLTGLISPHHLALILAGQADLGEVLQKLWTYYECNRRGPNTVDVTHIGHRFYAWEALLYRWCGLGVAGVTDGLKSIPILFLYQTNKYTGKPEKVDIHTCLGGILIQEFIAYFRKTLQVLGLSGNITVLRYFLNQNAPKIEKRDNKNIDKQCIICGQTFTPKKKDRQRCYSEDCNREYHRRYMEKRRQEDPLYGQRVY